jgi:Flp pilus assembly CpaF family ATPase
VNGAGAIVGPPSDAFHYKQIEVLEDDTSLVAARDEAHQQQLASVDLRERARTQLGDRLKPEKSGITFQELERGEPHIRARVETIARAVVSRMQDEGLAGRGPVIPEALADELVAYCLDWQFGAGPLEHLFRSGDVEDIVIDTYAPDQGDVAVKIWTYRQTGKRRENVRITPGEVRDLINRNAGYHGRALNATTPIVNFQMRNGARASAVLDPICDPYLSVTIRIHRLVARKFSDLIQFGTLTPASAAWLWLCVRSGLAMVVAGSTSSGKTNFLNAVARVMQPELRAIVIEDTRELDLAVEDCVYWQTREHPDPAHCVTQRDLVKAALRNRPDRIVLGEVRDGAAWDAIKATNTGHQGTLLSIHADDAESVMMRLNQLCSEAPETRNLSERTMREIIASAFQCVVFLERHRQPDGSFRRFVTQINEVNGMVSDGVTNQKQMFRFDNGKLIWTKQWPHDRIKRRMAEHGFSEEDIRKALEGRWQPWEMPF